MSEPVCERGSDLAAARSAALFSPLQPSSIQGGRLQREDEAYLRVRTIGMYLLTDWLVAQRQAGRRDGGPGHLEVEWMDGTEAQSILVCIEPRLSQRLLHGP